MHTTLSYTYVIHHLLLCRQHCLHTTDLFIANSSAYYHCHLSCDVQLRAVHLTCLPSSILMQCLNGAYDPCAPLFVAFFRDAQQANEKFNLAGHMLEQALSLRWFSTQYTTYGNNEDRKPLVMKWSSNSGPLPECIATGDTHEFLLQFLPDLLHRALTKRSL